MKQTPRQKTRARMDRAMDGDTTTPAERLSQFGLRPAKNKNAAALGRLGGLKRTAAQAIARAQNGRKSVAKMLATRKAKEAGK